MNLLFLDTPQDMLTRQLENIRNCQVIVGRQHNRTVARTTVADPYNREVGGGTADKRRLLTFTCQDWIKFILISCKAFIMFLFYSIFSKNHSQTTFANRLPSDNLMKVTQDWSGAIAVAILPQSWKKFKNVLKRKNVLKDTMIKFLKNWLKQSF